MTPSDERDAILFLQSCSTISLGDFVLARNARDRQLSKALAALLETVIENRALCLLGSLLRDHRKELAGGAPK